MDLKNHENNLRIIGKIFIVLGALLIPISISTFFFVDMFVDSDLWIDIREVDTLLFKLRTPEQLVYFLPIIQTVTLLIFLIGGYGLAMGKLWGRKFAIVPAVLLLFKFPIGTVIGGYMIYALNYEVKEEVLNPTETK